jgi:hypothetical protein
MYSILKREYIKWLYIISVLKKNFKVIYIFKERVK